MFTDRWKILNRAEPNTPRGSGIARAATKPAPNGTSGKHGGDQVYSRHSNGLEQFFGHIQGEAELRLLDFSGASQANIGFITNLGHRLYSEDFLRCLDLSFGGGDFYENQSDPSRTDAFLDETLGFPEFHFDGALIWDVLEFLSPPLLKLAVDRLYRMLRPGSYMLAFFHAEERAGEVQTYNYRIADAGTLLLAPRGYRPPAQFFNNRAVERLFQPFESVKFFLTRDYLREVIVKR